MNTKTTIFLLVIFINGKAFSQQKLKVGNHIIAGVNLMGIVFRSEFSTAFEYINIKKPWGIAIGASYHSKDNFVTLLALANDYSTTQTAGGQYGLERINSPLYIYGHTGYTGHLQMKKYFRNYSKYLGAQVLFGYRELRNGYYTDGNSDIPKDPKYYKQHYAYSADHFSKRIALTLNAGLSPKHNATLLRSDFGGQIGVNICNDYIKIIHGSSSIDKNFRTKNTDGLYLSLAFRIFYNVNFDLTYKRAYGEN